MTEEKTAEGPRYVSFQGRLFATLIDLILSSFLMLPFAAHLAKPPEEIARIMQALHSGAMTEIEASVQLHHYYFQGGGIERVLMQSLTEFVVAGAVVILFWVYRGATPGKMLLKMRIVDADTLGESSKRNLLIRYLGYIPACLVFFLGFIWVAIDRRKQGWHDKMANTVVIHTDEKPSRNLIIAIVAIIVLGLLIAGV